MTPTDPNPARDDTRGLYGKYRVERVNDMDGKHDGCRYFVLDPQHDPYAIDALAAYADACRYTNPNLSADIQEWIADE